MIVRFRSIILASFQVVALSSGVALGQSRADYTAADVRRYFSLTDPRSQPVPHVDCNASAVVRGPDGEFHHIKCQDEAGIGLPSAMGVAVVPEVTRRVVSHLRFNGNMRLTFETGSAVLTPHDEANVRQVVAALKGSKWADRRLSIDGYTDAQAFPQACGQDSRCVEQHNQALSQDRALAAKAYLVRLGVDANRIEAIGHGTLADAKVSEADRRVVIQLTD